MTNPKIARIATFNLVLLLAAISPVLVGVETATAQDRPRPGDKMPNIDLGLVLHNNQFNVDPGDLQGYVIVVEFWATWCGPCLQTIPHLNELHREYKDRGVLFIGISDEDAKTVTNFMTNDLKMEYLVASSGSKVSRRYGITGIPHAFLVDPAGIIRWAGHPAADLESQLAKLVKSSPPTRRLGGGPEHNQRLLTRSAQAILKPGGAVIAARNLRRIDVEALSEVKGHQARYESLGKLVDALARTELDKASALAQAQQYTQALAELRRIAGDYAGSAVGRMAAAQIVKLQDSPEVQMAQREAILERYASNSLKRAKRLAEKGQHVSAYRKLQMVFAKYPGTKSAEEARALMNNYEQDEQFMADLPDKG